MVFPFSPRASVDLDRYLSPGSDYVCDPACSLSLEVGSFTHLSSLGVSILLAD